MKKLLVGALSLGGVVSAFAEGQTVDATTVPTTIVGYFTPWIENMATAMLTLLAAGAVIIGVMFAWRVLKRVFNGSK